MKRCGGNRWWVDDATLVIRRERGLWDVLKGLGVLVLSAGLVRLWKGGEPGVDGVGYVVMGAGYALYSALGAWEVTLHRVTGRVRWRFGLGVPLFKRERAVADTERVQLLGKRGRRTGASPLKTFGVNLAGVSGAAPLAGSDDYAEAFALAEAVARHLRRGLQVEDGRVRAVEELDPPERARALAQMEARLLGAGEAAALASTRPVEPPLPPPPGCRIQVREEGEQRVVELPAPGWVGLYRLEAVAGGLVLLASLGSLGLFLSVRHTLMGLPGLFRLLLPGLLGLLLLPLGLGGFVLRRTWARTRTVWRITVSGRGLEVVHAGPGAPLTTRLAAGLIEDVDVRDLVDVRMRLHGGQAIPLLVIERRDGAALLLGEGLPREELEWAAARVRQELAALSEARRQELSAG
ncbi:hypothetical protein [Archangium sp.]|uniref:hypothetical protein n=1 Tax=Archangium sp. TaxID=1872627 RepID=UPI00389A5D5A